MPLGRCTQPHENGCIQRVDSGIRADQSDPCRLLSDAAAVMPLLGSPTQEKGGRKNYDGRRPCGVTRPFVFGALSPQKKPGPDATRTPTWSLGDGDPAGQP